MSYQSLIQQALNELNRQDINPRHIEGWMRMRHNGVLDNLDPQEFKREVRESIKLVDADPATAEELAESYGV